MPDAEEDINEIKFVHVDNRYLAVWLREHGGWKFVAYSCCCDATRFKCGKQFPSSGSERSIKCRYVAKACQQTKPG